MTEDRNERADRKLRITPLELAEQIEKYCEYNAGSNWLRPIFRGEELQLIISSLRAPVPSDEIIADEFAAQRIISARLTAWTDGYGGVDIVLAGGRRIAIALDAPHFQNEGAAE